MWKDIAFSQFSPSVLSDSLQPHGRENFEPYVRWVQLCHVGFKARASKDIQPVHPKGNQSWIFIGKTDAEAETPILWPPDLKKWLIGKDPDAGKDWGQEEKGTTEDEMVGWHCRHNGHGFGWTLGVGDGQGGLACCDSWGRKESDTTEQLNWILYWCFSFWLTSLCIISSSFIHLIRTDSNVFFLMAE